MPIRATLLMLFFFGSLQAQFIDVSQTSKLSHIYSHQNYLGGGVAFADINNDGYDDVYLSGGRNRDQLFLNVGDGTFTDITIGSGLELTGSFYSTSVSSADINNDGLTDFFIGTIGTSQGGVAKNLLLINQGQNKFSDVWIEVDTKDKASCFGALIFDFDLDGWLDIYTINYVASSEFVLDSLGNTIGFEHDCYTNRLYRNTGDIYDWEDVTEKQGLLDGGCSFAALASDFDQDGDQDILLANDFGEFVEPNKLYRNDIDQNTFTEVSGNLGFDHGIYGMGISAADVNHDGALDYYITNYGKNILASQAESTFNNTTDLFGLGDKWIIQDSLLSISWGCSFLDFDNDSYEDLYLANGFIPGPDFIPSQFEHQDHFFQNINGEYFVELDTEDSGVDNTHVSRGTATSDYDNDGDLDLIAVVQKAPANLSTNETKLYQNQNDKNNNWVQFDLAGIISNKDAIGARLELYANGTKLLKEVYSSSSHCSSSSKTVHFGLGPAQGIDSLVVYWPSPLGRQLYLDMEVNQRQLIIEDTITMILDTMQMDTMMIDTMMMDTMMMDTMMIDTMMMDTTSSTGILLNSLEIIYPNPADEQVYINYDARHPIQSIYLINIEGQIIQLDWEKENEGKAKANLNQLANGLHYLAIKTDHYVSYAKLVIAK